jgi:hypothetical protein
MDQVKKSDLVIFIVGIMIFGLLLLIPDLPDSMIYVSTVRASIQALKGQSDPSDLAQDVIGFRALVRQQNPYPVLGLAVQELDIEWDVKHLSAHPPTVFLFVAPIAFLPWGLAAMLWAWAMLGLLGCTFRLYGMSWPAAWGWTCIAFLWPPILTSLGQVTIIWLLGWTIGCLYARRHFWVNGLGIGLASLTKLVPILMVACFILSKKRGHVLWGVLLVWVIALVILMLLSPQALYQYVVTNRLNSMEMILRDDNASLLAVGYRSLGWLGTGCGLAFLGLVVWANKDRLFDPSDRSPSWNLWIVMSYVIVNLLPVFWIYSFTPLLPVIISLLTKRKLFSVFIGGTCLAVPFFVPSWGSATVFPFVIINLLLGIGLIADALPCKIFTAQTLKDMILQR